MLPQQISGQAPNILVNFSQLENEPLAELTLLSLSWHSSPWKRISDWFKKTCLSCPTSKQISNGLEVLSPYMKCILLLAKCPGLFLLLQVDFIFVHVKLDYEMKIYNNKKHNTEHDDCTSAQSKTKMVTKHQWDLCILHKSMQRHHTFTLHIDRYNKHVDMTNFFNKTNLRTQHYI